MDLQRVIKQLMKRCQTWNGKLFRDRKILIISDHNIISIPLKPRLQQLTVLGLSLFLLWSFYSNGRFMAYQGMIAKKEIEVMRSNMENEELLQLYDSLQGEMQGMNSFLDELKKTTQMPPKANAPTTKLDENQDKRTSLRSSSAIRVQMGELKGGVSQKLLDYTTKMEATIAMTGIKLDPILQKRKLVQLRQQALKSTINNDLDGMGGPYIPVSYKAGEGADPLKTQMGYVMALTKIINQIPFGRPIDSRQITSGFGVRSDPFTGEQAMHAGVDFKGPYGGPIHATAPGTVIYAAWGGEYGNLVEIDHGNGISTRYGHMQDIRVHIGQRVELGTVVGTQGNTGRSSGTHVHYEVRVNHTPQNPVLFLRAGGHV